MRGAKGIVHVVVREIRQLPRELLIIGLFFGVKAQIFE